MLKRLCIFISLFLFAVTASAQQGDSSVFRALGLKLSEYYEALKYEPLEVQKNECDFLIDSTTDSLVRQYVALDIYRHYLDSPVMGAENVAIHVYDKWFASGEIKMKSDDDLFAAKVYAEFNRQSLIGEGAPELIMESIDGRSVILFAGDPAGKYRIVFFYDADCSKCKIETILLKNLINTRHYPVDLYAIYAGDNPQAWEEYVSERLTFNSDKTSVIHLWDPQLESDFQRKYGVVSTPRLLLVDPDGVIIGRGLDVKSLEILLEGIFAEKELNYGTRDSEVLFDGIFASSDGRPSEKEVKGISDYIHDRTLGQGDTLMFRQLSGDYLYYLASHPGEGIKEGMRYHIDSNIIGQPEVWTSEDDSLKVISFALMMNDLLSKAAPGTRMPMVKAPGELYTVRGMKNVNKRLDRLKGSPGIIIFYTEGCEVCAAEKKTAMELLLDRKTKVLMINVDKIMSSDPSLASRLMDLFDLSSLPYILKTDKNGTILRRYLSLTF